MAQASSGFNQSGAALSPPGAMSQRTDLQPQGAKRLPDAAYGEQAQFQADQAGAPMAGQPSMPMPMPMSAPTQYPNEPVTSGAAIGDGPGPEALQTQSPYARDMKMLGKYIPQFEAMAKDENTPESFRLFVRYLRGTS